MTPVKYCLDTEPQRLSVSDIRHLGKNLGINPFQTSPHYEFIYEYSLLEKYPYLKSSTLFLKQVFLLLPNATFSYRKFRNQKNPLLSKSPVSSMSANRSTVRVCRQGQAPHTILSRRK
jgi:hypothetical protein